MSCVLTGLRRVGLEPKVWERLLGGCVKLASAMQSISPGELVRLEKAEATGCPPVPPPGFPAMPDRLLSFFIEGQI